MFCNDTQTVLSSLTLLRVMALRRLIRRYKRGIIPSPASLLHMGDWWHFPSKLWYLTKVRNTTVAKIRLLWKPIYCLDIISEGDCKSTCFYTFVQLHDKFRFNILLEVSIFMFSCRIYLTQFNTNISLILCPRITTVLQKITVARTVANLCVLCYTLV
jgi:hypothetical protein